MEEKKDENKLESIIFGLKEENKELKAEIERLTEEKYKVEQNLKQCENGYELELHTARFDMQMNRERVAELQKQVDELLNRRIEPKIFHCHADALETCPKVEQAVKDTAKEILQVLLNIKCCTLIRSQMREVWNLALDKARKEIAERYGVEVE